MDMTGLWVLYQQMAYKRQDGLTIFEGLHSVTGVGCIIMYDIQL